MINGINNRFILPQNNYCLLPQLVRNAFVCLKKCVDKDSAAMQDAKESVGVALRDESEELSTQVRGSILTS